MRWWKKIWKREACASMMPKTETSGDDAAEEWSTPVFCFNMNAYLKLKLYWKHVFKGELWLIKMLLYTENVKTFLNQCKKDCLTIFYRYREIVKIPKWLHSVMTSMTMFTPKQNLFNFADFSQKSKPISL